MWPWQPQNESTPAAAEALHNIMEALFEYDDLDAFIDENAAQFASYQPEGEQRAPCLRGLKPASPLAPNLLLPCTVQV